VRTFTADRGDHQRRLDLVLMRHLADRSLVSRSLVQKWIEAGLITVDGLPATRAAQRVRAGHDVGVSSDLPSKSPAPMAGQDLPLTVLFEDDELMAIDKPAGLVVHPTFGHADGTLMNALAHRARRWPTGRPSLVSRLDKGTSGVLLVAKSSQGHAALARALALPAARKDYLALCYGRMRAPRRRLRYPLGHDPQDRRRMVVRADGREAVTEVTRVAESRGAARGVTLVRGRLLTGRTHQVRAHLHAAGLPVVGDPLYGERGWEHVRDGALAERLRGFPRQALHAWRLMFAHPGSGRALVIEAPVPADLGDLLDAAYLPRGGHEESAT
jgi:23S rRNA pseudouridine1911/1915/1917 synthase